MLDFNPIQMGTFFTTFHTDPYVVVEDMIDIFKSESKTWVSFSEIDWYLNQYDYCFDKLPRELREMIYTELNVF